MPRVKAVIWDYFKVVDGNQQFTRCLTCSDRISRGGKTAKNFNTTNMIDHLQKKHPVEYKDYEEKKKLRELKEQKDRRQPTMEETRARVKIWDINEPKTERIHRKIAEMMALDYQPLSVVNDVGFTRLLQTIEPKYKVPSRKYFTDNVLPKIKENINTKLAQLLKDVEFLSLTTDIWSTSLSNESLISMTAHWIGDKFKRMSAVLHAQKIEGSHTGVAICQALESMLENWKISKSRRHMVVADNASNMKKALREGHFEAQGCFAHTLQLIVNDGVLSQRAVIDTLAVCRSVVGHFKHSTIAYHKLDQIRERLDIKKHKLQQDEPTRWNSTLYMLQTIFEQKTALAAYATEHGGITMLTPNQIELTRKLIVALEPVEEITKMISTDTASISVLIPLVKILQKALNKHDDDPGIQTMKTEMLTSLERRFDDIEESELLLIATCLDPRFKDKFFSSEVKGLARKCVIDNIADTDVEVEPQSKRPRTESSNDSSVDAASTSKVWECFTEILHDCGATTDNDGGKEVMVDQYFSEPLIDHKKGNPYTWWHNNQLRYPLLAKLAKRYLCSPPTSVPSERLFSGAGILYDERRNRLTA